MERIRQHAEDFISKREAPAYIANDGKQTPMRGHPVFIASMQLQHVAESASGSGIKCNREKN